MNLLLASLKSDAAVSLEPMPSALSQSEKITVEETASLLSEDLDSGLSEI